MRAASRYHLIVTAGPTPTTLGGIGARREHNLGGHLESINSERDEGLSRTDRNERSGSFVRWQAIFIAQLTFAVNITLGLAGASLAFGANLVIKEGFQPSGWTVWMFPGSLAVLLVSMGLGVWCVISRLLDFRTTMEAARRRETGAPEAEIKPLRDRYVRLGNQTWRLFWCQIATFVVGVFLMVSSVIGAVWSRAVLPPPV